MIPSAMSLKFKYALTFLFSLSVLLPSFSSAQTGPEVFYSETIGLGSTGFASFDCDIDQFELSSSADGITGELDKFQFVYRQLTNDVDIKARIEANSTTVAGLMIRSGTSDDQTFAMVGLSGASAITRYRYSAGQATSDGGSIGNSSWLRIRRSGDSVSSYTSSDGSSWVQVDSKAVNAGSQVFVGMVAANGTATFSNVTVIGTLEPIVVIDPGPVDPGPVDPGPVDPGPVATPPNAPSNLVAVLGGDKQVNLSWNDNSGNETGFRLERSAGSGAFGLIASLGAGTSSYVDGSVDSGNSYSYRVVAYNDAGNSDASNTQSVSLPSDPVPSIPIPNPGPTHTPNGSIAAPTGLTSLANSGSQITLYWQDNADNEQGFRIERHKEGESFSQVAELPFVSRNYFEDTGLEPKTRYYYRVYAYNSSDVSDYTNEISSSTKDGPVIPEPVDPNPVDPNPVDPGPVDPGPVATPPNAPSNLVAVLGGDKQVNLSWNDNSGNETGFRLERSAGSGAFGLIASLGAGTSSYVDGSVDSGNSYSYRVVAYNDAGNSDASNTQSVSLPSDPVPSIPIPNPGPTHTPNGSIAAPTGLTSLANSGSQITLYWQDNADNEQGFRIERHKEGESFSQVAELPFVSRNYFEDTGLEPKTRYYYRVYAYNSSDVSDYTNEISSSTKDGPVIPEPVDPGPVDPGSTNSEPTQLVDETFSVNEIGTADLGGTASYDSTNDMFRLSADGGKIWGTKDDFHYVYREVSGDVEATVKVSSLEALDELGKAGIMFRQSADEDARHAFLTISAGKGVALERRHEIGGGTTRSGKGNVSAPIWLRLIKEGTYISAYYSEDGDNWSFLSEDIIDFNESIFIGLAVAAHSETDRVTADFGDLNVVELQSQSATETFISADIGKVGVNGDAAYDSQTDSFIVEAAGGDIGHIQDAFHYVFREVEGDFETVTKIDSLVAERAWAKAGLMIRDSFRPDAPYFAVFMAQDVGVVHQHRGTFGGDSDWSKIDGISTPIWVKVSRTGNLYQGHYSLDGANWILVNQATIALSQTLLVGMAVTSHEEGALAYAEFSNLTVTD